jgi:lysozyme family protein
MALFELAIGKVLEHEGGYSAGLPGDPGGETNFGITKRYHPDVDIKALTKEAASEILRTSYWRFDSVEDQLLANCALDCAVNQGLGFAEKALGVCGNSLLAFQALRVQRYRHTAQVRPQEAYALKSWLHRTYDV